MNFMLDEKVDKGINVPKKLAAMIFRYFSARGLSGDMEIIPKVHGRVHNKYPIIAISWNP